ncbi:MAG: MASE3 domain-containing protein, partial [Methylomonas sp.]
MLIRLDQVPLVPFYLVIHTFLETFTVVIAGLIFTIGWSAYRRGLSGNILIVACAFMGVGILDFSHMFSFTGMPDFVTPSGPSKAIDFWLFARLLAAGALLWISVTDWFEPSWMKRRFFFLLGALILVAAVHWLILFQTELLPQVYIQGQGLTAFKIRFEYFIIAINLLTAAVLSVRMREPLPFNAAGLFGVVLTMAMSEVFFTRYQDFSDIYNLLGHIYKIISYLFLYYAIFIETIELPYHQFRESQNQLQATLDALPDILLEVNKFGHIGFYRIPENSPFTISADREQALSIDRLMPAEARKVFLSALKEADNDGISQGKQIQLDTDGGNRCFELSASKKQVKPKQVALFIVLLHDITSRKQVEAELRIAATAFESQQGIMITDADNVILRVNKSFSQITGYSTQEVIGQTPKILASGRHNAKFYAAMWQQLNEKGSWEGEIWNKRKNGRIYPQLLSITVLKDLNNAVRHYVASFTDITVRKVAEGEIQKLAFYDPLTQLPNRRMLLNRMQLAMAASKRTGKQNALLFIDMDNFKTLNDTLGHGFGDLLLQLASQRLLACVRECDTAARIGGDEFLVLLSGITRQYREAVSLTRLVGEKILRVLNQPFQLGSHKYHITPSMGITLFNQQIPTDDLLKQADIAMYQAKKAGRNTLRFFDPQMQHAINIRAELESQIRRAIDSRQFRLFYQIQVNHEHQPIGAEALIRWQHPEKGVITPGRFISLAEETGLILQIGYWVLETACAQLKEWQYDKLAEDLILSVNVYAQQFRQTDFV